MENVVHRDITRILRPHITRLFFVLAQYLFIPTDHWAKEIMRFQNSMFYESTTVESTQRRKLRTLGIHLRARHPEISVTDNLVEQMMRCAEVAEADQWFLATDNDKYGSCSIVLKKLKHRCFLTFGLFLTFFLSTLELVTVNTLKTNSSRDALNC